MRLKPTLKVTECQIRGHRFPSDDVNRLFSGTNTSINSFCIRCETPFVLVVHRRSKNEKTYRIRKIYSYKF